MDIRDILSKLRSKHPQFGRRMIEAEALGRWAKAVGPQIAKNARALSVKAGVLWVEVDHPIWHSEIVYRKQQILDILNAGTPEGEEPLKDLRVIGGGVKTKSTV